MNNFTRFLWRCYRLSPVEVEPTPTKGYWRCRVPCAGAGECGHPIHGFLGHEAPIQHTIHYLDEPRDRNGRWASPYRTWRTAVARSVGMSA